MPHLESTLSVLNETLALSHTQPEGSTAKPSILFIHGAGQSTRSRTAYLAESLAAHGHTSLRFDHSGHGESTGNLSSSSLSRKLEEARAMLPLLQQPLTLIGSSMGAHIATRLTAHAEVANLILIVPATYGPHTENIPFGEDFTRTIRTPGSWHNSAVWPLLENFTGALTLITAGEDDIIPPGVIRNYWNHAHRARRRTHLHLPQAPHAIHVWLSKNPQAYPSYLHTLLSQLSPLPAPK